LVGKRLKAKFLKSLPAVRELKQAITDTLVLTSKQGRVTKWKRRYLKGLDGRLLYVRSPHSALNTLLQSAGALICKKWIVRWEQRLIERGLVHGWQGDFAFLAWVHDECQVACRSEEIAKVVIEEAQKAMEDAREFFGIRVPLGTEGKIGRNWAECH
jgi:DNA polymerase I-like protein with 3'-5' exonuclease and polymerase domains